MIGRDRWTALLAAVIGMGLLIVIGTVVLITLIVVRLGRASDASPAVVIEEPGNPRIVGASSDGRTLTLILATPSGTVIEVRALGSGQVLAHVIVRPVK